MDSSPQAAEDAIAKHGRAGASAELQQARDTQAESMRMATALQGGTSQPNAPRCMGDWLSGGATGVVGSAKARVRCCMCMETASALSTAIPLHRTRCNGCDGVMCHRCTDEALTEPYGVFEMELQWNCNACDERAMQAVATARCRDTARCA